MLDDQELVAATRQVVIPPTAPSGGAGVSMQPAEIMGFHPDKGRAVLLVNIGTTTVWFIRASSGDTSNAVPIFVGGAVVLTGREPVYAFNGAGVTAAGLLAVGICPPGMTYSTPGTGTASSTVAQGAAGAQAWPVDVSDRAARLLGVVVQGTAAGPTAPWSVYNAPAPGSIQVSGTALAAAALSVALPAVAGKVNYLQGFTLTSAAPAATVAGLLGITGVNGAPLNFQFVESTTVGGLLRVEFADPLPATAANQAITVALPAIAGGAATALVLEGSVQ